MLLFVLNHIYFFCTGGEAHTDVHGVRYARDPHMDRDVGTASDFGKNLIIARVLPADQVSAKMQTNLITVFLVSIVHNGAGFKTFSQLTKTVNLLF